jgi:RNA polymerase sigma-70 factor (ECF subfamily)
LQTTDAQDVRQLVMIKLARLLPDFVYDPSRGRFRDYLYRAIRSSISDLASRPNRTREVVFQDSVDVPAVGQDAVSDARWEEEWAAHHYRLAMEQVRRDFEPRSVEVFEKLLAGESVNAVAAGSNLSEQAVHKIKQRIRDRLRELIDAQIRDEDRV